MLSSTLEAPILIVGAAHVVDLARPLRQALAERPLDAVAVELDPERAQAVLAERPPGSARGSGAPFFLRLWAILQRRLGEELGGGLAGAEMRAAAGVARERSIPLLLIDDPIRETVARLLRALTFRERVSLVVGSVAGLFIPSRLVARQIEAYQEEPSAYLEEVRRAYPTVARVLLDERNEHMADRLFEARRRGFGRVAAVVGDAHRDGLALALRRRGIPVETIAFSSLVRPTGPSSGSS